MVVISGGKLHSEIDGGNILIYTYHIHVETQFGYQI